MESSDVVDGWAHELTILGEVLLERGYSPLTRCPASGAPTLCATTSDAEKAQVLIFVDHRAKVGIGSLRRAAEEATRMGSARIIMLAADGATPFVLRELKNAGGRYEQLSIEIFRRSELAFNVLRHCLVPKHRALNSRERRALMSSIGCRPNMLPRIRSDDPIAKLLGASPGTVLQIERTIGHAEVEVYYRVVV
jgi:DNA-directed RNA polymerase subunit H (RpoH/RPB5)